MSVRPRGALDTAFARVGDALAANLEDGLDIGASVALIVENRVVVDLVGGFEDLGRARPWRADALAHLWSVTKAVSATLVARRVDQGAFDYEDRIAADWPAFAAHGKEEVTVGQLMAHQAGVPGISRPTSEADLCAHDPYVASLAAEPPLWPPGTDAAYHPVSAGQALGEYLRRVDARLAGGGRGSRGVGAQLREEITGPRALDVFIGVPEAEDPRAAQTVGGEDVIAERAARAEKHPAARDAILNPPLLPEQPNRRSWRAAEIPGGNGFATALGLASLLALLIDRRAGLASAEVLARATAPRVDGPDRLVETPLRLSAGFMLNQDLDVGGLFGPTPSSFGHTGWGGPIAFVDPEARAAFAFLPNHMLPEGPDHERRRRRLVEAMYADLAG